MSRAVCLLFALAVAACDHAATAVESAGSSATVARGAAVNADDLDRLEEAVRQSPGDHRLVDRYRESAIQHHAVPRALTSLQQLAADATTGRVANVHYQLGMAYIDALKTAPPVAKSGLAARALASFDVALARDPDLWDAAYAKGLLYLKMPASFKQYPKAIETFTALLSRQAQLPQRPEFALTYVHLGEAYMQGSDRRRAEMVLRDGISRFPDQSLLRDALTALQQEQKR